MDRAGLRRTLLKAQAEAGDIVLLFGDESEALTHPYLAHVWAKKGADLRIPAPGQSAKVAMLGVLEAMGDEPASGPGADGEQSTVRTRRESAAAARRIPRPYVAPEPTLSRASERPSGWQDVP